MMRILPSAVEACLSAGSSVAANVSKRVTERSYVHAARTSRPGDVVASPGQIPKTDLHDEAVCELWNNASRLVGMKNREWRKQIYPRKKNCRFFLFLVLFTTWPVVLTPHTNLSL